MGPQLDSCGRRGKYGAVLDHLELQWGRNLTVAEGHCHMSLAKSGGTLQWGRNLTVAEGATWKSRHWAPTGFNGAAT